MDIQFIGATEEVTGSMTLISNEKGKILIDCGMYQGVKDVVLKNKEPLPFNADEIDAIILTHAHLDHSGLIPRLVKLGFRGTIYCTRPTMKLARLIMSDCAGILKSEKHLLHSFYEAEHAAIAVSLFKTKKHHEVFNVIGLDVHFISAGHILGASSAVIKGDKTIVFSGDLGRTNDPLIHPPEPCPPADIVIMESTYGGRVRTASIENDLHNFLRLVKDKSKVGIVASFAVARSQMLITLIHNYFTAHPEEKVRLVIDSPMMVDANNVYKEFSEDTNMPLELKTALSEVEVIDQPREWTSIQKKDGPLIVIASSGMVSGGRIWRYLENWQQDTNACLFLPGYQGEGTAGRLLSEGKRIVYDEEGKKVHWHGEVMTSSAFSSHADQSELIGWLKNVPLDAQIYLNHGEIESKKILQEKLQSLGHTKVEVAGKTIRV